MFWKKLLWHKKQCALEESLWSSLNRFQQITNFAALALYSGTLYIFDL